MRSFMSLVYDPKKFIASLIILLWVIPLLLIGMASFTAKALVGNGPLVDGGAGNSETKAAATGASYVGAAVGRMAPCPVNDSDDMGLKKDCRVAQPTHKTITKRSQPTPVIHQTTVINRTVRSSPVPQRVVHVTSPARSTANTARTSASATAQAVVNVSSAAPQVASAAASTTNSSTQAVAATTPTSQTYTSAVTGKTLPNTGPADVFKLSGVVAVAGTIGHWFYIRRRLA